MEMINWQRLNEIQQEVGKWSELNFGNQSPNNCLFGLAEEVGELCHAHLKGVQGIRHSSNDIEAKKKDALGDIIIYLLDFCHRINFTMNLPVNPLIARNSDDALNRVVTSCSDVFRAFLMKPRMDFSPYYLMNWLGVYADHNKWDIMDILEQTWIIVKERDWKKSEVIEK